MRGAAVDRTAQAGRGPPDPCAGAAALTVGRADYAAVSPPLPARTGRFRARVSAAGGRSPNRRSSSADRQRYCLAGSTIARTVFPSWNSPMAVITQPCEPRWILHITSPVDGL